MKKIASLVTFFILSIAFSSPVFAVPNSVRLASVSISPTTSVASQTTQYTVTLQNDTTSTASIGSLQVLLPTGFGTPTVSNFTSSNVNHTWSFDTFTSNTINVKANTGTDKLDANESVTFKISTTNPANSGSYQFTSHVFANISYNGNPEFTVSSQPTVTVSEVTQNPVPTTSNISPTSATVGASGFTLTVNGTNFINGSVVRWNGSDRTTTYVSATQLTASISSSDVAHAGTASVTVFNPAPTGGTSSAQTFTINKATPVISWGAPVAITYGTALSETQLNAQLSVAGSATYTPNLGTILNAGAQTLSVHYVPTNTADYNTPADATVSLVVNKAQPVINWENPADVVYTTSTLSGTQLNATVSVNGPEAAPAVTYSPIAGTVLPFGNNQTLTANTAATTNYLAATKNVSINIVAGPATQAVISADTTTKEAPGTVILTSTLSDAANHLVVNGTNLTLASTFGTVDGVGTSVNGAVLRSLLGTTVGDATLSIDGLTVSGDTSIHFVDTRPPVITLIGSNPIDVHFGETYTDPGATALDAVDGDVTASIVKVENVDTNTLGDSSTVTYNVTDAHNNVAKQITRTVRVVDVDSPIITLLGNAEVTIEAGSNYVDAGATARDNVDMDITANIVPTGLPINTNVVGDTIIRYNVSDSSGNPVDAPGRPANEITRTVHVVDTTAPTISIVGDNPLLLKKNQTYTEAGATASDTVSGDVTGSITTTSTVNTAVAGTYTVTYSAHDGALPTANATSTTRTVIVRELGTDATLSALSLENGGGTLSPAFASTTKNYTVNIRANREGLPSIFGTTTDQFATKVSGNGENTRTITVTAEDGVTTKTYTVTFVRIEDHIPPVITILGNNPTIALLGKEYEDAGATALDNIDGDLGRLKYEGTVNTQVAGSYVLTYTATDASGNTASSTRSVTVRPAGTDATLSVLSLSKYILSPAFSSTTYNYIVVIPYNATVGPTIFATTTDSNATKTITPPNNVAGGGEGRTGTIRVVAEAGGENQHTYSITFVRAEGPDTTLPVVTVLGEANINLTVGAEYSDAGATAFDSLDGDLTSSIITTNSVNTAIAGTYSVVYAATDSSGNTGYGTRMVTVSNPESTGGRSGGSHGGGGSGYIVIPPYVPGSTSGTSTAPVVSTDDTGDTPVTPTPTRFIKPNTDTVAEDATSTDDVVTNDAALGLASTTATDTQGAAIGDALANNTFVTYLIELVGAVILGYGIYYGLVGRKKRLFEKYFGFKANPENQDVVREVKKTLERLQAQLQSAERGGDGAAIETAKAELAKAVKIAQGRGHN